jgi:hypothetical protein
MYIREYLSFNEFTDKNCLATNNIGINAWNNFLSTSKVAELSRKTTQMIVIRNISTVHEFQNLKKVLMEYNIQNVNLN